MQLLKITCKTVYSNYTKFDFSLFITFQRGAQMQKKLSEFPLLGFGYTGFIYAMKQRNDFK